jgi:NADH:ubiquinone oxidoreductase subunit 5 (subunit L)/multisubunit Na+/H+ antiporter MnhA subunit
MTPYLSLAIWVPIVAGLAVLGVGRDRDAALARWIALVGAIAGFVVTIPLYTQFDANTSAMQFVENLPWIERFNVRYHLGVDGISMWFVPLTAFMTVVVVLAGWQVITERVALYMGAFLVLSGLMIGVFCALDGILFYAFFEGTLIPMYIIIGVWGGPRRVYAAFKFFLFTLAGVVTAWWFYLKQPALPDAIARTFRPIVTLLENKYYMDWINEHLIAPGARAMGRGLWKGGDQGLIDAVAINGSAAAVGGFARLARMLQTGHIYWYALVMLLGVFALLTWRIWPNLLPALQAFLPR